MRAELHSSKSFLLSAGNSSLRLWVVHHSRMCCYTDGWPAGQTGIRTCALRCSLSQGLAERCRLAECALPEATQRRRLPEAALQARGPRSHTATQPHPVSPSVGCASSLASAIISVLVTTTTQCMVFPLFFKHISRGRGHRLAS